MTNTVQQTPAQLLNMALDNYAGLLAERDRINENLKLVKATIERLTRENNIESHQTPIQGTDKDLKVTRKPKQVRVLDVNELSVALGVSVAEAKKKETLMRAVAEGRLTLAEYEQMHFYEQQSKLSIRRVKAGN